MPDFAGGGPDSTAVYLWIISQYEAAAANKAKKDLNDLGKEGEKAGKTGATGLRGMTSELRNQLRPISELRFTIYRLGFIWAATFGAAIALAKNTANTYVELDKIAKTYGKSIEQVSKDIQGVSITNEQVEQAKRFRTEWQRMEKDIKNIAQTIGEKIARGWNEASVSLRSYIETTKALNDEFYKQKGRNPTTGEEYEMKKSGQFDEAWKKRKAAMAEEDTANIKSREDAIRGYELEKAFAVEIASLKSDELGVLNLKIEAQEREFEVLGEYGDKAREVYSEVIDLQRQQLLASQWGLQTYYQEMDAMQKQFGQATVSVFGDIFIDALDNKLANSKEIFRAYLVDMRNMLIKFMMEQAVLQFVKLFLGAVVGGMTSSSSGSQAFMPPPASSAQYAPGLSGGTAASGMSMFGGQTGVSATGGGGGWASGGWVGKNGPEKVLVGEKEPELIIPQSQLNKGTASNVSYYITAVDAASFNELVARNPGSIVAVTENAIRQNKSLRRTIKNFT